MADAVVDIEAGMKAFCLQSGTALYTLVGDRVHIDPPGFTYPQYNAKAHMSIALVDGSPEIWAAPLDRIYWDFKGWGRNPSVAMQVMAAIDETLNGVDNETVTSGGVTYSFRTILRETTARHLPNESEVEGRWFAAFAQYLTIIQTSDAS